MRQPARISSQLAYGLPEAVVESARPKPPSPIVPLLLLVVGLAAATVWYVGLPALSTPVRAERSCEVYVLKPGVTKCVPQRPRAAKGTASRHTRPKHTKR